MTTCMETWLVADRAALAAHFGNEFRDSALPPLKNLESRHRHDVQDQLMHATRNCSNAYAKGKRSFEVLGKLVPGYVDALAEFCASPSHLATELPAVFRP